MFSKIEYTTGWMCNKGRAKGMGGHCREKAIICDKLSPAMEEIKVSLLELLKRRRIEIPARPQYIYYKLLIDVPAL